jgi:uncharacterized membrane protein
MSSRSRTLVMVFAALGLAASATSTYVHYQLLTRPGYTSVCDVSATVSCTDAYLSEYGSFGGVPVAPIGVLYFVVVLLLAAFGARPKAAARESVPGYIFVLSTLALAFVLYLAYGSFFVLKAVCLFCLTTYVSVIAIFLISGSSTAVPMTTLPHRAMRDSQTFLKSPLALVLTILLVAGAVTVIAAFPREGAPQAAIDPLSKYPPLTDGQRADFERWWDVQPRVDLPIDKEGARVLVVKFNDFQCPPCRQTYNEYKGILAKYTATGQVRYMLKHFPLEGECNSAAPGGTHRAACEAAAAYVMAQGNGTADALEEWLFANQASLTADKVREGARQVSGIADFDARYQRALASVRTDAGMAALVGVNSTPTFYINGRKIAAIVPTAFEYAIQLELKRNP